VEQSPRSITIITHYYPPSPAVGGLRAAKVAQAFQQAGHQVTVVTAIVADERPGVRLSEPGLIVQAVQPLKNPREWYAHFKRRGKNRADPTGGTSGGQPATPYARPKQVPQWKRFLFSLLWLPDAQQGFILPAIRAAALTLRDTRSVIYTTAPPFSDHLAGLWLNWRTGRPWVAEFRDPWTDNPWKPWYVRSAMSDGIERRLERQVLRRSNLVVAVSAGIERVFTPKVSNTSRLLLVRNGIERLMPAGPSRPPGRPLRILHVGTFYHGRDPRLFLQALASVVSRLQLGAHDVRVDLVGRARWYDGTSIEAIVNSLGLQDVVHFEDWVPHARAQEMVESADILLLLAQNQPDQVPNKLYEYFGTRRPILAFADAGGESAALLHEAGGHEVFTGTELEPAEAALERMLRAGAERIPTGESLLHSWTTQEQMKRLVTAVEDL
jgi:glycosyltransferase involved in cell wall biosynthesis